MEPLTVLEAESAWSVSADVGGVFGPIEVNATPLTPRGQFGLIAALEQHGTGHAGIEVYHTGVQALENDPYRDASADGDLRRPGRPPGVRVVGLTAAAPTYYGVRS